MKKLFALILVSIAALAGCQNQPPGLVICHTYKFEQAGLNFSVSAYDPASQSPAFKAQAGVNTMQIIPSVVSSNGQYTVQTPVYSSGTSVGQNGSKASIWQSGNGWTSTGPVATFNSTNVVSTPATNWNPSTVGNNIPK